MSTLRSLLVVPLVLIALPGCTTKAPLLAKTKPAAPAPDPWGPRPTVTPIEHAGFPAAKRIRVGAKTDAARPGLNLVVVERHDSAAVFLTWVIPGGRALEFVDSKSTRWPEGTVDIMAEMLTEGSVGYRGSKLAAALQRHGAELNFRVEADALVVTGRVLSHQLDAWLRLAHEAMLRPTFESRPLHMLKKRHSARLKTLGTRPHAVAARAFNRLVYGATHPYGSPGLTEDTVDRIKVRDLRAARRALVQLGGSTLAMVGDVDAATLSARISTVFGDALASSRLAEPAFGTPKPAAPGCHVIDIPKAVQSLIVEGNLAPRRGDPSWSQLILANQVLGGSASSRLFSELRERRGLTYGVYSSFDGRQRAGDWSVSTSVRTAKAVEALVALNAELKRMQSKAPGAAEIASARRYLVGQFIMAQTSGANVAARLASLARYDRADDYWQHWVQRLHGAKPAALKDVAKRWMGNPHAITLIVGNLAGIRPALDERCPSLVLHDSRGRVLRHIIGTDAAMSDADRARLFMGWAKDKAARPALDRYLANTTRSAQYRATALYALLAGPQDTSAPQIGDQARDWPKLAAALVPLLVSDLTAPQTPTQLPRARAAHRWLLDLASPTSGRGVLSAAVRDGALQAIAAWAFDEVRADGLPADVRRLVMARLIERDLARLGRASISGLEALVSTNVWRVSAARALIALDSVHAARSLAHGYRRAFVIHRAMPSSVDLGLLARSPDKGVALLLFDVYALHRLGPSNAKTEQILGLIMATLHTMIDALDAQPLNNAAAGAKYKTVLERDFAVLMSHFESLLSSPDPDDRWWAADHLVRFRSEKGLRIVLQGLADDDAYAQSPLADVKATEAFTRFARSRVAPMGEAVVRPLMLAALAGRRRVAKVLAITSLRSMRDVASMTVLRTHNDVTRVGRLLGLSPDVDVRTLARAAAAVRRYISTIDKTEAAGRLDGAAATAHREEAYRTFALVGRPLAAAVSRAVEARLKSATK